MTVRVRVPATVANFGPAFDVLGVAVALYNTVDLDLASSPHVEVHGEGEGALPADETNLVYRAASAAAAAARRSDRSIAFALRCRNDIPLGRGLGSSAAAIAAGLVGANELLGRPLASDALFDLAWRLEGHPDNVAAALFGGVVLCDVSRERAVWTRIEAALDATLVAAIPEFSVATEEARAVLPTQVALRDAVTNVGRTAWLVAALLTGRTELLSQALDDVLHQPYRTALVPGMEDAIRSARAAGAYGAVLSGSGPTIVAVAPHDRAPAVGRAMVGAFERAGHRARHMPLVIDREGTRVIGGDRG